MAGVVRKIEHFSHLAHGAIVRFESKTVVAPIERFWLKHERLQRSGAFLKLLIGLAVVWWFLCARQFGFGYFWILVINYGICWLLRIAVERHKSPLVHFPGCEVRTELNAIGFFHPLVWASPAALLGILFNFIPEPFLEWYWRSSLGFGRLGIPTLWIGCAVLVFAIAVQRIVALRALPHHILSSWAGGIVGWRLCAYVHRELTRYVSQTVHMLIAAGILLVVILWIVHQIESSNTIEPVPRSEYLRVLQDISSQEPTTNPIRDRRRQVARDSFATLMESMRRRHTKEKKPLPVVQA